MSEEEILELSEKFKEEHADAMMVNLDGKNYYLVYEKSDIKDWIFLGLVKADIVNASMNSLQLSTLLLVSAVVLCIAAFLISLIIQKNRRSLKKKDMEILYRDELLVVVPCGHPLADAAAFPLSALSAEPFIRLEEGRDYELTAALDAMGVHPNVKYTAREDRTILAMVSKGLGISLLPELMVRRSPYPVAASHAPERFYRNIGIAVKDEKAQSASTRRFVDYVRRWVAENGEN